jgi:hypothetical protein
VRRLAGQAARHTGRVLHVLAQLVLALVVIICVALAGAAWRLAQGPVELAWLVPLLQDLGNADAPIRIRLGGAAIAWEGFSHGFNQPLDIRLTDVEFADTAGRRVLAVPHAALAISPGWLLVGRIAPRAVALQGARLHVRIAPDGGLDFDFGPQTSTGGIDLPRVLRELAARPGTDRSAGGRSIWSQLRRVRIEDAAVAVDDRRHDVIWSAPSVTIDLFRRSAGGIAGNGRAALALGDIRAGVVLAARVTPDGQQTEISAHLTPIGPAAIARVVPTASVLSAVEAPVALSLIAQLGPNLALASFTAHAAIGAGTLHLADGTAPLLEAEIAVQGTPRRMTAELVRLVTAPHPDGPRTTITGHAELIRAADHAEAAITADLDQVAFADLPALWPAGIGGPGTRPWIAQNITEGTAHSFHVEVGLRLPPDFSDATVTHLAGGGNGSDLTVHWLRPVPPIVHGEARLNFLDPDSLEVIATAGEEILGHEAIGVRGGRVLFTGIAGKDQFADINADLAGPVPAALALLKQPRIGLLDRSPVRPQGSAGEFTGHVAVTRLPLRIDVSLDDMRIRTALKLTGARLLGIAAGRDLDRGMLDLTADPDGLHAVGKAAIAGIPVQLQADMDFRAGPPSQVLQNVSLSGSLDATQLADLGLNVTNYATGMARVAAQLAMRRDRTGLATVEADLTDAALTVDPLAWRKPRGQPARVGARVALDHDRIATIDGLQAEGTGLRLAGSAAFADGKPSVLRLDHLVLGEATDLRGSIIVPHHPGEVWRADLFGASLDASGLLKRKPGPPQPEHAGPPYLLDARLDRVVFGPGRSLASVTAHAENDGRIMRRLAIAGQTEGARSFRLDIEPVAGARRQLSGNAADAGALLRALDIVDNVEGGRLEISGSYDDAAPGHPLTGRIETADFRVRHAPILAKLLQAMTLYGIVDVIQGPGLGFSRLVAPLRLANDVLTLSDARAFSPSLGMTAKGQIDLGRKTFDMEGTIVPAYFFNSLLGDLPIVGKLFSPERGGGVFAATYSVHGPLDDPRISVNPLAALTPGFLRGLFGLF